LCLLGLIRVLQANGEPESLRHLFLAMLIASAIAWLCAWGLKKSHVIVAD
jgi:hypothetical protein